MDTNRLIFEVARINGLTEREASGFIALVGEHPRLVDGDKVVVQSRKGQILMRLTWPEEWAAEPALRA